MNNLNKQVEIAEPTTPFGNNYFFYSEQVPFVAACIISTSKIRLEAVKIHPLKPGNIRVFFLSPKPLVQEYYQLFINGKLLVDPKQLYAKTHELLRMEIKGGDAL